MLQKYFFLLLCFCIIACEANAQLVKGMNVVGPFDSALNEATIVDLQNANVNFISFTPEVTLNRKSLDLESSYKDQWTATDVGYIDLIRLFKKHNLEVVLKPHLILDGTITSEDKIKESSDWRGNIKFKNTTHWNLLETNYKAYILKWAQIAEAESADAFLIGTELKSFVQKRPDFWNHLIDEVRKIYSGPVSYSANWDNYKNIPFWHKLNFIGTNAYFPITGEASVTKGEIAKAWSHIKDELEQISMQTKKKILLTEYGYRNIKYAGRKPWLHVSQTLGAERDDQNQYLLLENLFKNIWTEDYILGGFLWNWNQTSYRDGNTDFSIRNKPSEKLLKDWYGAEH